MFRAPIRSKRCLILADGFIEGTTNEKLDKPHLVYDAENERLLAMAGIWDEWVNKETGEVHHSFAIITTPPNKLLQKIPHHRSPLILPQDLQRAWISNIPLHEVRITRNG